jgi:hypothetical protein
MAFSEFSDVAPTAHVPSTVETATSTNNMDPNGQRLMHAPLTANNATRHCELVYRAAQAYGIAPGGICPPENRFPSHPDRVIEAEAASSIRTQWCCIPTSNTRTCTWSSKLKGKTANAVRHQKWWDPPR